MKTIILILILTVKSVISSLTNCQCFHILERSRCEDSSSCLWRNGQCTNNSYFLMETSTKCYSLTKTQCIGNVDCMFLNGQCVQFSGCEILNDCASSINCISNGEICIPQNFCQNFLTQIACSKQIKKGIYCLWDQLASPQCYSITTCNQLPQLRSHILCQRALHFCTINDLGYCQQKFQSCTQYKESQCYETINQVQCEWNTDLMMCQEKNCENGKYSTDNDCKQFLDTCTSNGTNCILRQSCNQIINIQGCVTDQTNNKCHWNGISCLEQICSAIPQGQDCFSYFHDQKCTTTLYGYCKDFPQDCEDFETEQSCNMDSQHMECFWRNEICLQKSCSNAPQNSNCQLWKNDNSCMSNSNGFCVDKPQFCNQITDISECSIIQLQNQICQPKNCSIVNCLKAPKSYNSHQQCEDWSFECTINILEGGCIQKLQYCNQYDNQEQCKSVLDGNQCTFINQLCQKKLCEYGLYYTNQDCQNWNKNCIYDEQYQKCIDWPNSCNQLLTQQQCNFGLQNGQNCDWNGTDCIDQLNQTQCINALKNHSFNTHAKCNKWNSNCTVIQGIENCQPRLNCENYQNSNQCIVGIDGQQCFWDGIQCLNKCKQQNQETLDNLVCQGLDASCTLNDLAANCSSKQPCSDYQNEYNCKSDQNGYPCIWNSDIQTCEQKACELLTELECFRQKDSCSYKNNHCSARPYFCIPDLDSSSCQLLRPQIDTLCYYDSVQNICAGVQNCEDIQSPLTIKDCRRFNVNCIFNQNNFTCETGNTDNTQDCYDINDASQCLNSFNQFNQKCLWLQQTCINYFPCIDSFFLSNHEEYTCQDFEHCRLNQNTGSCEYKDCSFITDMDYCQNLVDICFWEQDNSVCQNDCQSYLSESSCLKISGCFWDETQCIIEYCSHAQSESECFSIVLQNYQKCIWLNLSCLNTYTCSDIIDPLNPNDCLNYGCIINYLFSDNSNYCQTKKTSCGQYNNQHSCTIDIRNNKCQWDKFTQTCLDIQCQTYTSNNGQYDNEICSKFNSDCVVNLNNTGCRQKLTNCNQYQNSNQCMLARNMQNKYCFWNGNQCIDAECNQYDSLSQPSFSCFEYAQCTSLNRICTNSLISCNSYQNAIQCNQSQDQAGNFCGWVSNICQQKTCDNYPFSTFSHIDCQGWLLSCTSNFYNSKCIQIIDCTSAPSEIDSMNTCELFISPTNETCTVSQMQGGCIDLPQTCNLASKTQCFIDGNKNKCYWSEQDQICKDLTCGNIDSTVNTALGCQSIMNSCTISGLGYGCQKKQSCSDYSNNQCQMLNIRDQDNRSCMSGCQQTVCEDYLYQTDILCQSILDGSCITNGQQCITNNTCTDFAFQSQCSISKQGVQCFWLNDQNSCVEKQCLHANESYNNNQLCQQFLSKCNYSELKQQCTDKQNCNEYDKQELCQLDKNDELCIWHDNHCYDAICKNTCGDGILDIEKEECDDGNLDQYDGCYQCQYSCVIRCLICNQGICQECDSQLGYQLDQYNNCVSSCGDQIIQDNEECDDGNLIQYDGCYLCQYSCVIGCLICDQGICQECDYQLGYYVDQKNNCNSKCGDQIIQGIEQCDDGNFDNYDECNDCQFQCHFACKQCIQGICYECDYGWSISSNHQCEIICGDGHLMNQQIIPNQIIEQCDDGNLQNQDGCSSKCQIEDMWFCQSNSKNFSSCDIFDPTKMILTLLTEGPNIKQDILVSFSRPLKQIDDANQLLYSYVLDTDKSNYNVTIMPLKDLSFDEYLNIEYVISVTFFVSFEHPILQIEFDNIKTKDLNDLFPINHKQTISLYSIYCESDLEKRIVDSTKTTSQIILFVLTAIGIIAILSQNLEILWNLLDMIQYLSYVKYINIEFPQNLNNYFETFDMVTVQPAIDFLNLQNVVNLLNYGQYIKIETTNKFKTVDMNAFYFYNFISSLTIFCVSFILYFLSYQSLNIIYKLQDRFQKKISIFKLLSSIQKSLQKFISYFFYSGMIRTFFANAYDISFTIFLQLYYPEFDLPLKTTSFIIAAISFAFIFHSIILIISKQSNKSFNQFNKFLIFSEETVKSNRQLIKQFSSILLIKKLSFMWILVFMQKTGEVQTLMISFTHIIYSLYLYQMRPIKNKFELVKNIFFEISISLTTTLFIFYSLPILSIEQKYKIGWVHIVVFTAILSFTATNDIIQQQKPILQRIYQLFLKKEIKKQNLFQFELIPSNQLNMPHQ